MLHPKKKHLKLSTHHDKCGCSSRHMWKPTQHKKGKIQSADMDDEPNAATPLNEVEVVDKSEKCCSVMHQLADRMRIRNEYVRVMIAEFLGTFVLVALGDGIVAQTVLSEHEGLPRGNINTIHVGWGLAVTMGVLVCGGVSGGHINPAFSVVAVLIGHIPLSKLPFYWVGQYLGAFSGAVAVFVVYYEKLNNYDRACHVTRVVVGNCSTAGIFSTYPTAGVSNLQGFADQIFGTFLLVLFALAIIDNKNFGIPRWFIPFIIGLAVNVIVGAYEFNCGAALNPARDLGPRVFTSMAGWGRQVFTSHGGTWFLVPIFGPHLGALLAALFYTVFISLHWPKEDVEAIKLKELELKKLESA